MSRNPEYKFVETDTESLVSELVSSYEKLTKVSVQPASPEKLFILWVANIILQERVWNNYTGNQNIPSRSIGENLNALGQLFYETERPAAQAAVCTERFYISAAQNTSILIPAGTRVTDTDGNLVWETTEDAFVKIGELYADVPMRCQTVGIEGNGYEIGQLNTLVDVFDYYDRCENITVSDDGADEATDEEYYELLRSSMDGYSCAGAKGGYAYFAKQVSTEISDVVPNQPSPGCVNIYILMNDGTVAGEEIKKAVLEACNADVVRPLTDYVSVADAEVVDYNISLKYFIQSDTDTSAATIADEINNAVREYVSWQCGKFGRDINPDKLREYLSGIGIKRIEMSEPAFTVLRDGKDNTVPQIAHVANIAIINGGYEDE